MKVKSPVAQLLVQDRSMNQLICFIRKGKIKSVVRVDTTSSFGFWIIRKQSIYNGKLLLEVVFRHIVIGKRHNKVLVDNSIITNGILIKNGEKLYDFSKRYILEK